MPKFKNKPMVIDAYQWNGDYEAKRDPKWITEAMKKPGGELGAVRMFGNTVMKIVGKKGLLNVIPKDYVVRMPDGSLTPMDPTTFEQFFSEV